MKLIIGNYFLHISIHNISKKLAQEDYLLSKSSRENSQQCTINDSISPKQHIKQLQEWGTLLRVQSCQRWSEQVSELNIWSTPLPATLTVYNFKIHTLQHLAV